jgi:hypothetical protein
MQSPEPSPECQSQHRYNVPPEQVLQHWKPDGQPWMWSECQKQVLVQQSPPLQQWHFP